MSSGDVGGRVAGFDEISALPEVLVQDGEPTGFVFVDQRCPVAAATRLRRRAGHIGRHRADVPVPGLVLSGAPKAAPAATWPGPAHRTCLGRGRTRSSVFRASDTGMPMCSSYCRAWTGSLKSIVANVEGLARVDRVDVGVDRPRLHLQVRPAALRDVAHAADGRHCRRSSAHGRCVASAAWQFSHFLSRHDGR